MKIKKQSTEEIKKEIKSDRASCVFYAIMTLILMITFICYAFILVHKHPVYALIAFGFYSTIFTVIVVDYKLSIKLNKILLEVRDK